MIQLAICRKNHDTLCDDKSMWCTEFIFLAIHPHLVPSVDNSLHRRKLFPLHWRLQPFKMGTPSQSVSQSSQDTPGFQAMATSSQSVFLRPIVAIAMPFSATACEILCALSTNTIQRVKYDVQMIWWRSLAGQKILHYTNWTCNSFGFFWCASVGVSGYSGCKVLLQFSCASFILRRHGKCIAAYPLANSDFLHGGFLKWGAPKSSI